MADNRNSEFPDRFDRRILEILQTEGRISNQALAERVNLSPSPCLRRVRALEAAGLITGYRATVDDRKLGYGLNVVLMISMDQHTPERFEQFEARVAELPEVQECLLITGQEAEYLLRISVVDMDDYQRLLLQHITRIPGVSGVHSSFVLRRVLHDRVLPPR
ncbi:Lrp/AsnC family transcriptional regulator [Salinisphaera sp. SPP-AMP-43]|uniref:Lrp/AsnC family transcriptional regulator n=1 Tax=Salinisphaera sp. SPP-AMP-43 TaxID=3121288 RepID=UPI003C6E18C9